MKPRDAAVLGPLIADAAALGLHWLYDPARIAEVEANEGLVFLTPDTAHYAGTKGYFAHGVKRAGELSGYGEVCLLMLQHLARHGEFKRVEYQTEYRAHFGPGGAYVGYIDLPTRQTLNCLLPLQPEDFPAASGADDDQHPALAALPAIVAAHTATREALRERVEEVVRITNNDDVAVCAAHCLAQVLFDVLNGVAIRQAMMDALPLAGLVLQPSIEEALALPQFDSVAVAQKYGPACHVTQGLPVIFHILQHAQDYRTGIEANIRAGGDSCGRAIMLGSILAAAGNGEGIPLSWQSRVVRLQDIATAIDTVNAGY